MSTKEMKKKAAARPGMEKPDSLFAALKNGGPIVWLSCLIMGLANMAAGEFIKGLLFLAIEAAFVVFMAIGNGGIHWISMLPSLGDQEMSEIWNDDKGVYEYVMGDN